MAQGTLPGWGNPHWGGGIQWGLIRVRPQAGGTVPSAPFGAGLSQHWTMLRGGREKFPLCTGGRTRGTLPKARNPHRSRGFWTGPGWRNCSPPSCICISTLCGPREKSSHNRDQDCGWERGLFPCQSHVLTDRQDQGCRTEGLLPQLYDSLGAEPALLCWSR